MQLVKLLCFGGMAVIALWMLATWSMERLFRLLFG